MTCDRTDEGEMQRANGDTPAPLSPAALFAAEVDTLDAAITDLPKFPKVEAARAKLRDCQEALDVAQTELNAKARFGRATNGGKVPDKPTQALIDKRDRAQEARQKAVLAVHRERDEAQTFLTAHMKRHAPECAVILGEVAVILRKLGHAMRKANEIAERDGLGVGHIVFTRAYTLLAIAGSFEQ
jgi:hypothetical protein